MTAEKFYNENFVPKDRKRFCKYELTQFAEAYAKQENKRIQKELDDAERIIDPSKGRLMQENKELRELLKRANSEITHDEAIELRREIEQALNKEK